MSNLSIIISDVKKVIKKYGVSEVSRRTGISKSTLYDFASGKNTNPSVNLVEAILAVDRKELAFK